MDYNKHPGWRLFLRSLTPSAASLTISFTIVVAIIGMHLLVLSRDADLFLPYVAGSDNEQLAGLYASNITQPLDRAFGNSAFAGLSSAFVWGMVGWIVYSIADFLLITLKEIHTSETNIRLPLKNQVIPHPMHRQMIIRVLWRLLMSLLIVVTTFLVQPWISWLLKADVLMLRSSSALGWLQYAGIIFAAWMGIFHIYVVLFRLFVLRTRFFGEIVY